MTAFFNEVQDILENYTTAVREKDVEKFVSAYASDIHVYDCWGDWEFVGFSRWRESVKEWFDGLSEEGVTLKIDFGDVAVEENSDLAFVRCVVTFAAYNELGQKLRQIANRFTFGLRKEEGSWLIRHQHSSLPINMETGKGIFNLR
jgi:uncharacterized protein (TIGR02246 family)